jgi:hypothetical protein
MYSSAKTSINKTKTPAVFKKVQWTRGTKNIDWGGGKYDTATVYLSQQGVSNWIYDPYNRTPWENRTALLQGPFDTATCSNVLNVIYNIEDRLVALKGIRDNLKVYGVAYITVYEGDKSGQVKVNVKKDSCQLNRRLKDYLPEIQKVFENDTIILKYGVITIIKEEE